MKKFLFLFLILLGSAVIPLTASSDNKQSTIDLLTSSPERYYNDALAAESQGNQMEALLALRRALILEPRLKVAQDHLETLLKKMGLPREGSWQTSLARSCSPELLVLIGSLVGWSAALLFVGMLFFALGRVEQGAKKGRWPFLVVLFFFFAGHAVAFLGNMIDPRTIAQKEMMITDADQKIAGSSATRGIPLRSTPADNASIIVQLPPGICVTLLSQHGFWSYIKTASGPSGWVPSSVLEALIPLEKN
ncbi:MAG: SH3 domain-containing protein [Chthoniobacterales bacterium]|nr:SH3 domain-containing protein [Chthoniobacterales bacterium]